MTTAGTHSPDRPAVDVALLVVRVVAGVIFAAHGAQKLADRHHDRRDCDGARPAWFFLGRAPTDQLATAGFEYNLALIGLLAPTLIAGPGRFAIGRFLPLPKSRRTGGPIVVLE